MGKLTRSVSLGLLGLSVVAFSPAAAVAQDASPYAKNCISLAELQPSDSPPQLARAVRDCVETGRFADAVQVFFAYSVYGRFDKLRVRDEANNDALVDLNNWMFAGISPFIIANMRGFADDMRGGESAFFLAACGAIADAGVPTYSPDYMIGRGVVLDPSDDAWRMTAFDADAGWQQALVTMNGCPSV